MKLLFLIPAALLIAFIGAASVRAQESFTGFLPNGQMSLAIAEEADFIWTATSKEILRFSKQSQLTQAFYDDRLVGANVTALAVGSGDVLWIGTNNAGLLALEGSTFTQWPLTTRAGSPLTYIASLLPDSRGRTWVLAAANEDTTLAVATLEDGDWTVFDESSGLPSSTLRKLVEHSSGDVWAVGGEFVEAGHLPLALQFQDQQLTIYRSSDGLPAFETFEFNIMTGLALDSNGGIWAGNNAGAARYLDGTWSVFNHLPTGPEDSLQIGALNIEAGRKGEVFVASAARASVFTDGKWQNYRLDDGDQSRVVRSIAVARNGDLWVGTRSGISRLSESEWTHFSPDDGVQLPLVDIVPDRVKGVYAAFHTGLSRIEDNQLKSRRYTNAPQPGSIRDLMVDRTGNVWLSYFVGSILVGGVSRYDGEQWEYFNTETGLLHDRVFSLATDREANVWVSSERGVSRYDGEDWTAFDLSDAAADESFFADFALDSSYSLWVSSFSTYKTNSNPDSNVVAIHRYRNDAWETVAREAIGDNAFFNNRITGMAVDPSGNVWAAGIQWVIQESGEIVGGLYKYDGDSWTKFALDDAQSSAFGRQPQDIFCDNDGNVWILYTKQAGRSGTVSRFDGVEWQHNKAVVSSPLESDLIQGWTMSQDIAGNKWIGLCCGAEGVARTNGNAWKQYTTDDGLLSSVVTAIDFAPDRSAWFATQSGVSRLSNAVVVTDVADRQVEPNEVDIVVFPNPIGTALGGDIVAVSIHTRLRGILEVSIVNSLGANVEHVREQIVNAGDPASFTFDAAEYSSGVYFVRVEVNDDVYTRQLIIRR